VPGLGTLLLWAGLVAWAAYLAGLARGRFRLRGVRDAKDALQSRWLFGGLSAAGAAALMLAVDDLSIRLVAVLPIVAGVAVVRTARRHAPMDETTLISATEIKRKVRDFAFESRPLAHGPVEAFVRTGWTVFIGAAGAGAAALAVLAAFDLADNPHLEQWERIAFIIGLCGGLVVLLTIPSMWWVTRAIRRVPALRMDEWGVVLGRDRLRDTSIGWDEIGSVEVRTTEGSAIRDVVILLRPRDPTAWKARQNGWMRLSTALSQMTYGAAFAISTAPLDVSVDEILSRIAVHKPSLIGR